MARKGRYYATREGLGRVCGLAHEFSAGKCINPLTWFGIGRAEASGETFGGFVNSCRRKIDTSLKIMGLSSDKGRMER